MRISTEPIWVETDTQVLEQKVQKYADEPKGNKINRPLCIRKQ